VVEKGGSGGMFIDPSKTKYFKHGEDALNNYILSCDSTLMISVSSKGQSSGDDDTWGELFIYTREGTESVMRVVASSRYY